MCFQFFEKEISNFMQKNFSLLLLSEMGCKSEESEFVPSKKIEKRGEQFLFYGSFVI